MVQNKARKSKQTEKRRRRRKVSSTKGKEITLSDKITFYLNEALSI